jgi:hypothetical protein
VTRAVHEVDPEQPIMKLQTMEQHMGESLAHQNFSMRLLSVFAGLGTRARRVGIYSVLAYGVGGASARSRSAWRSGPTAAACFA